MANYVRGPTRTRIPAETVVREDWEHGLTSVDMAELYGVSVVAVEAYLEGYVQRWIRERPMPVKPDERRIVITREVYEKNAPRRIRISLPRISMHVAAMEDQQ